MPQATDSPPSEKLVGRTEARLWTQPLRPLTRETTRGFEVIEFAEMIGEPLLPWQDWLAKHVSLSNLKRRVRIYTAKRSLSAAQRGILADAARRELARGLSLSL